MSDDTSRRLGSSLLDDFRQPGKISEWFAVEPSCGVLRKGAFTKDLIGEVQVTRTAKNSGRNRIPGYGDEVQMNLRPN